MLRSVVYCQWLLLMDLRNYEEAASIDQPLHSLPSPPLFLQLHQKCMLRSVVYCQWLALMDLSNYEETASTDQTLHSLPSSSPLFPRRLKNVCYVPSHVVSGYV